MSRVEYEHERTRAELLGVDPPSWEQFSSAHHQEAGSEDTLDEGSTEADAAEIQELSRQGEEIKRTGGGLEELNAILTSTQHKINKFKTVCGSFTNLIKLRGWKNEEVGEDHAGSSSLPATPLRKSGNGGDVESEVTGQNDRLDALIGKAERAEMSLHSQNKQMRHILIK